MIRGPSQAQANLALAAEITALMAGLRADPWILPRRPFAKMRGDNLHKLLAVQHKLREQIAGLDSAVDRLIAKLKAEADVEKAANVSETQP